ncbi:hypothetical protein GCM10011344_27630 [Dokdonia pacifica]|uniref:Uncharacterized protein n=1 Tax=Dokdonia pacifica TaxID=1627892 RepID=A0A239CE28_9FLAO|nr:hypothetical protein [Dokdonia pacifica]GGG25446.1 hypothetical protein GCM10011344_27630 [Dokdonia pacifica]SNS18485.1 hypothetical protein SAMN06265376_107282 [Dokdonia pacifica]
MEKGIYYLLILFFSSCGVFKEDQTVNNINNRANDVTLAMKGYQPIDPIKILVKTQNDSISMNQIINQLPNEATRIAIGKINQNGSIAFGPFNVAKAGESYTVIVDYIKYITTSIPAEYNEEYQIDDYATNSLKRDWLKIYNGEANPKKELFTKLDTTLIGKKIINRQTELRTNHGVVSTQKREYRFIVDTKKKSFSHKVKIPVYVGVGLRIQASVTVVKDSLSLNLGSLYGLAIAASKDQLNGTLVIQTLGISGENISPAVPIPDRINETTIQAAMQSLATIKSKIYDVKTQITPQVVAFGLPYSIEGAKDLIESSLHTDPPLVIINSKREINFQEKNLN